MDYSKYKFNYFDVVKRHERIINRPKDWEIKVLAIIMLFVTFCYVFTSGVFASAEVFAISHNYWGLSSGLLVERDNRDFYQYIVTPGNEYKVTTNGGNPQLVIRNSDGNTMILGDYVTTIVNFSDLTEITFTCPDDVSVIGILTSLNDDVHLYNESPGGYETSVSSLVNDVGTSQIWGVFENGINFVGVVVFFAFGLFLVVLAIRKVSKGKSEF